MADATPDDARGIQGADVALPDASEAADAFGPADAGSPADTGAQPLEHQDVTVQTVRQWMLEGRTMTIVDVREPSEYGGGHLEGAINLPWTSGVLRAEYATLDDTHPIVVYCASGNRSNAASTFLAGEGVRMVYDMGGIRGWTDAGYPVVR